MVKYTSLMNLYINDGNCVVFFFYITIDSIHSFTSNDATDNSIVYYEIFSLVFSLVLVLFAIISRLLYAYVGRFCQRAPRTRERDRVRHGEKKKAFAPNNRTKCARSPPPPPLFDDSANVNAHFCSFTRGQKSFNYYDSVLCNGF